MTPGARVQAAIEILDQILAGMAAEQALTRWARASRFAGSKDRRAVRDHVFDALRQRRSAACLGGAETGRGIMLGLLRGQAADVEGLFTSDRHMPAALTDTERAGGTAPEALGDLWNLPDWLVPHVQEALGARAEPVCKAMSRRAPTFVRVNTARTDRATAAQALAGDGIANTPHTDVATALILGDGATKLRQSQAFAQGWVEPQDAASQDVVLTLPDAPGPILDYCAGGGGKTLALAARYQRQISAWDAAPARMTDVPQRAARAGADIDVLTQPPVGPYGLVLCDAPCSGSGSWRRAPDAKWAFQPADLDRLTALQDSILDAAQACVAPGGVLAYATCSILRAENEDRVAAFLTRAPDWQVVWQKRWDLGADGDGFFATHLMRV